MKGERKKVAIALAVMGLILAIFLVSVALPLWIGTDVYLKTRPIDPFDPFRGQYLAINYEISSLPIVPDVEVSNTVYVPLIQNGDTWDAGTATRVKPSSGVFLKGTVTSVYQNTITVRYGIEQFFIQKGSVYPTQNITVHARVAGDGGSRIVELLKDGKPVNVTYSN